ncbi:MAG: antibiotic biosynthesis monooxygenase family protein [Candidatus Eiseniibacteriota bacterium]
MLVAIIEYALRSGVEAEFQAALAEMLAKVREIDGFLGEEPCRSVTDETRRVTISYWRDAAALEAWRKHPDHQRVMLLGRKKLLAWYRIRVARIERDYGVPPAPSSPSAS